jgi:hypothetical protein
MLQVLHLKPACRLHENSVRPRNVRPPKSLPATSSRTSFDLLEQAARRDSAVHVSLSSDSLVKQPGTECVPLSSEPESRRSFQLPMSIGSFGSPNISEVLHRRDIAPRADDAPYGFYIVLRRVGCQHQSRDPQSQNRRPDRACSRRRESPLRGEPAYWVHGGGQKVRKAGKDRKDVWDPGHAALRPHSSAVLWVLVGGVSSGVVCARIASSVIRPALPEIG